MQDLPGKDRLACVRQPGEGAVEQGAASAEDGQQRAPGIDRAGDAFDHPPVKMQRPIRDVTRGQITSCSAQRQFDADRQQCRPLQPLGLVRKLGREFLIAADDIEWLQASGNYVNLHVAGRAYPLRSTLSGIEARLDTERFARIHRSYLVNLGQIESIEPLDTGDARIHLRDGTVLPCSRSYREAIRSRFAATMGKSGAR